MIVRHISAITGLLLIGAIIAPLMSCNQSTPMTTPIPPTPTPTPTPIPPTLTATAVPSTPTPTPTSTAVLSTPTPTLTATAVPPTPTPTPTATPILPTYTPTPTTTSVPLTPTPTATPIPPTPTPTPTSTPIPPTLTPTPTTTPVPPTPTPTPTPTQIPGRAYLYDSISPPMAPAYIDWRWNPDQGPFREIETDFTIHNDIDDWYSQHGYYLILIQNSISGVGFYFGLQTHVHDPNPPYRGGRGLIFSRWKTRDLKNARVADAEEGWTESAGHEGDFIGVRRSYRWGAGNYRVRIAPDGLESDGEWFGLWITDLDTNETTWIGSLKFPLLNGTANIKPYSSATIEIYGIPRFRPIDIPQWHVSVKRPLGDNIQSEWGFTSYPFDDSDNPLFNSDVQYDHSEDRAHLLIGGTTERTTPPSGRIDFK